MGLFNKDKYNLYEELKNDALFSDDDDDILVPPKHDGTVHRDTITQKKVAPHAITADELMGNNEVTDIPMTSSDNDSGSVYKQMTERNSAITGFDDSYVPSWATFETKEKENEPIPEEAVISAEEKLRSMNITSPVYSTPTAKEELEKEEEKQELEKEQDDFLARCRRAVSAATANEPDAAVTSNNEPAVEPTEADEFAASIKDGFESIKAGKNVLNIEDIEEDIPVQHTPAEIEDIIRRLKNAGDVKAEAPVIEEPETEENAEPIAENATAEPQKIVEEPIEKTEAEENPEPLEAEAEILEAEEPAEEPAETIESPEEPQEELVLEPGEKKLEVEVLSSETEEIIMETTSPTSRVYGKIVDGELLGRTLHGTDVEIDTLMKATAAAAAVNATADDKTMMFEGLTDALSQRADDDFDDEFDEDYDDYDGIEETPYYETNDPALASIRDYRNLNDAARIKTDLDDKCQSLQFRTVLSFLLTAASIIYTSNLFNFINTGVVATVNLLLLLITAAINYDIFLHLKNLAKLKVSFGACISVAVIVAAVHSALNAFVFADKFYVPASAAMLLLAVGKLTELLKQKRIALGLNAISTSEDRRGVVALSDDASAVVSSGAVDGEALTIIGKKTVNVQNFLKHSNYLSPLDLKAGALILIGIAVGILVGVIVGVLKGGALGFAAASLALCCCFPACSALTAELPMFKIAKHLAGYRAMLAGFKGAYDLNLANVVAVKTCDLFPKDSVKLYDMKTLSENEIGHSLLDAAAVAVAAKSPMAPILQDIIGQLPEKDLPKVGNVQYEDKMGVSGWIGERTILIGNRNLMQGHNITVPPITVDQKILRAGYFPVYVACDGVPCLLFIVKYETDPTITAELQSMCNTGITVVVDPNDPNATDMMLCDYFGLPSDAIKVMNHNARVTYEKESRFEENISASASFKDNICGFFAAVTASINLPHTLSVMTALFIIAAVVGLAMLIWAFVSSKAMIVTSLTFALYQLLFVGISFLLSKVKK